MFQMLVEPIRITSEERFTEHTEPTEIVGFNFRSEHNKVSHCLVYSVGLKGYKHSASSQFGNHFIDKPKYANQLKWIAIENLKGVELHDKIIVLEIVED